MHAVLVMLTPGRWNKFIDCQKAKVQITVLLIIDVKTWWNSIMKLLEGAYQLREFTHEWLKNPTYIDYRPLLTISVSNRTILGPLILYWVKENPEPAASVPVFTKHFPELSPAILIREFRAWYVTYVALHPVSFGGLRFSISSKLSKWLWKYSDFSPTIHVFAPYLA